LKSQQIQLFKNIRKSKKENWIAIVMVVVGLRWWLCSFYGALISGLGRVKEASNKLKY
jgi:hypothetical protein